MITMYSACGGQSLEVAGRERTRFVWWKFWSLSFKNSISSVSVRPGCTFIGHSEVCVILPSSYSSLNTEDMSLRFTLYLETYTHPTLPYHHHPQPETHPNIIYQDEWSGQSLVLRAVGSQRDVDLVDAEYNALNNNLESLECSC